MSKLKILYVASEVSPFLSTTDVADYVRALPENMQQRGLEVRIFVPRFGVINERKNRLHEVVRLSGISISVADDEKPLMIKVASIPEAKLQVYFIDNEDFFHRRRIYADKSGKYFEDNEERAIFFCKGVIETVKKLGWAPDIVHCNDWMSSLIAPYLKITYKNDPLFKGSKILYTIYDTLIPQKFNSDLIEKALIQDITGDMLHALQSCDCEGFVKVGAQYADRVTLAQAAARDSLNGSLDGIDYQIIERDEQTNDRYYELYHEMTGVSVAP
ncbi:MAG: glycogen/starch synthase [Bernardetiaceae bacterium]